LPAHIRPPGAAGGPVPWPWRPAARARARLASSALPEPEHHGGGLPPARGESPACPWRCPVPPGAWPKTGQPRRWQTRPRRVLPRYRRWSPM